MLEIINTFVTLCIKNPEICSIIVINNVLLVSVINHFFINRAKKIYMNKFQIEELIREETSVKINQLKKNSFDPIIKSITDIRALSKETNIKINKLEKSLISLNLLDINGVPQKNGRLR